MKTRSKNNKEGISLIVLVITIIVMIILAAAVILSLSSNGIIDRANEAVNKTDVAQVQNLASTIWADAYLDGIRGEEKLYDAIREGLRNAGINVDDYEVVVTENGLEEVKKATWVVDGTSVMNTKTGQKIQIGAYINYNPNVDKDGKQVAVQSYTSYSEANASENQNLGRTSGYTDDQVFNLNSYTAGWQVLGTENGQILLISEDIVSPTSGGYTDAVNGNKYYLKGINGVRYGIQELNAISSMYAQGEGAIDGRSVNEEDINKITGYNPEKQGDGTVFGEDYLDEYGNELTIYWEGTQYPYIIGDNGADGGLKIYTASSNKTFYWLEFSEDEVIAKSSVMSTTATTTKREEITKLKTYYYYYYPTSLTTKNEETEVGMSKESKAWKMLFENTANKKYWLASRAVGNNLYVGVGHDSASWRMIGFGFRTIEKEGITVGYLYDSGNYSANAYFGIRPVVTLSSDIQILDDGKTGETISTAYNFEI